MESFGTIKILKEKNWQGTNRNVISEINSTWHLNGFGDGSVTYNGLWLYMKRPPSKVKVMNQAFEGRDQRWVQGKAQNGAQSKAQYAMLKV